MHSFATFALVALVAALAACGGKSAPKSAAAGDGHDHAMAGSATDGHDHDHHATGSGDAKPAEPATPIVPAKPAEPPPPDPAQVKAELLAAEKVAFENAKPVFDKSCAKCHSKSGKKWSQKKGDHFDMSSYPFGGHHAMEISGAIRKSLAIGGGKPTMPFDKPGAVKGADLALIAAWADAFDKAHAGGAHEGKGHGHDHGHKH